MSMSRSTSLARLQKVTRMDCQRLTDLARARRILLAGLLSIAACVVADVVLVAAGTSAFHVPASFGPFNFGTYALLTTVGIVGATAFGRALAA